MNAPDVLRSFELPEEAVGRHVRVLRAVVAGGERRRSRRRRRRFVVPALAGVLLAAPAAIAFGSDVADFFRGKPAPPPVQRNFDDWRSRAERANIAAVKGGLEAMFPAADGSRARGVLAVETTDGPLYLWAAPRVDGEGECWLIQLGDEQTASGAARGTGGCDHPATPRFRVSFGQFSPPNHPSLSIVFGRAFAGAVEVEARLASGEALHLPVVDEFFVGAIERESPEAEQIVRQVVAYDAAGDEVGRQDRGGLARTTIVHLAADGASIPRFDAYWSGVTDLDGPRSSSGQK